MRWKPQFKKAGFAIYTAKKPKPARHDLTKDAVSEASGWTFQTILPERHFACKDQGSRALMFPLDLPAQISDGMFLRIGVYHGYDDTGDRRVKVYLADPNGEKFYVGASGSRKWKWFERKLDADKKLSLLIEDTDTKLTGKHPGNGGSVKVALVRQTL